MNETATGWKATARKVVLANVWFFTGLIVGAFGEGLVFILLVTWSCR